MAALQETSPLVEQYAHSLGTIRRLGSVALNPSVLAEQQVSIEELARADFTTAVTEMLKTDPEFRQKLDIENSHAHQVINGKVRAADGTPMVEIIETGYKKSEQIARFKPEFKAQATRDYYDLENARRVDELRPGQTLIALSMEPKHELKTYKQIYAELGYKEGLAYLQYYSKVDESTLVAGSYSVDLSDENTWRGLFADLGIEVPEGESPNTWIRHALEVSASAEEAQSIVKAIRENYYQRVGSKQKRNSATDYVNKRQQIVNQFFDSYYPVLAEAATSGQNNKTLKTLAQSILSAGVSNLDPTVMRELMRIANSEKFDDEAGKLIDSVIRYAAVEELRKELAHSEPSYSTPNPIHASGAVTVTPEQLNQLLAKNIAVGTTAQRSYGGCAGQIKLNKSDDTLGTENINSPQDIFGGKAEESESDKSNWKWKQGICRVNTCPTRPGKTEIGPCAVCRKCQAKFDAGVDPTKAKALPKAGSKVVSLFEFKNQKQPESTTYMAMAA